MLMFNAMLVKVNAHLISYEHSQCVNANSYEQNILHVAKWFDVKSEYRTTCVQHISLNSKDSIHTIHGHKSRCQRSSYPPCYQFLTHPAEQVGGSSIRFYLMMCMMIHCYVISSRKKLIASPIRVIIHFDITTSDYWHTSADMSLGCHHLGFADPTCLLVRAAHQVVLWSSHWASACQYCETKTGIRDYAQHDILQNVSHNHHSARECCKFAANMIHIRKCTFMSACHHNWNLQLRKLQREKGLEPDCSATPCKECCLVLRT